jgi:ribosomal-protein-serine acetyltransferase
VDPPILIDLPEQMVGDRVLVRPYRAGDGQAVFDAVDESRDHILPWLPWGPFHTCPEETEKQVRKWRARWDLREDLAVGIWDKESGDYCGGSGLHRIDWSVRSFEIGYWIRKSKHGSGYVTEAVRLLTLLAFDGLAANRVFIRCAVGNDRSAAVPRRLGYREEGILRASAKDANGEVRDVLLFAITRPDWPVSAVSSPNSG